MTHATQETQEQLITRLLKENAALKARGTKKQAGDAHVSESGMIVMVRGLNPTTGKGQWPVSMYPSDWELVFANADKIKALLTKEQAQ